MAIVVHYGQTMQEKQAAMRSNGHFEGPMPLCGNGNYHCAVTRVLSDVTCEACLRKLNLTGKT